MMKNYREISSPWTQLSIFMVLLGAGWILGQIAGLIILTSAGIDPSRGEQIFDDPGLVGLLKVVQGLSTVIVFALPALLYARRTFGEHPFYFLGMKPAGKSIFFALAVILLLVSIPFESWLGEMNKLIHLPSSALKLEEAADKQINAFLKVNSPKDVYINLFLMALLPAVCEELCFRGALQRILIQIFKKPWTGILVTAIFFSAFHMQFQGFLPRMFLGMLLGGIYWYSGSLWTSILAHSFFNGIQVLAVSYYPKMIHDEPSVPIYAALISLVIVVGLLTVLHRKSETSYAQVYEPVTSEDDGFPS